MLLSTVYFSYRQTIAAYPAGRGSYIVASANLGQRVGLFAAAALMIDYILNVAVGISAGVGALVSAIPKVVAAKRTRQGGRVPTGGTKIRMTWRAEIPWRRRIVRSEGAAKSASLRHR